MSLYGTASLFLFTSSCANQPEIIHVSIRLVPCCSIILVFTRRTAMYISLGQISAKKFDHAEHSTEVMTQEHLFHPARLQAPSEGRQEWRDDDRSA